MYDADDSNVQLIDASCVSVRRCLTNAVTTSAYSGTQWHGVMNHFMTTSQWECAACASGSYVFLLATVRQHMAQGGHSAQASRVFSGTTKCCKSAISKKTHIDGRQIFMPFDGLPRSRHKADVCTKISPVRRAFKVSNSSRKRAHVFRRPALQVFLIVKYNRPQR